MGENGGTSPFKCILAEVEVSRNRNVIMILKNNSVIWVTFSKDFYKWFVYMYEFAKFFLFAFITK